MTRCAGRLRAAESPPARRSAGVGSAEAAGEGLEAVLGDEPVDDVQERGEVVCGQLGDGGEAVAEDVLCGVKGAAGDTVGQQVVDGDVEYLGEADEGFRGRGDAAGLVAGDAAGIDADLLG